MHALRTAPSPELAQALERFEQQFSYPLGPGRFFRISHGEDYPRFFRAIGEAACFVAEREGSVLGVIGAALRRLLLPSGDERPVVYLGDLKLDPAARGGRALPRLAQAVGRWVEARAKAAFGVVMDGTSRHTHSVHGTSRDPALPGAGKDRSPAATHFRSHGGSR